MKLIKIISLMNNLTYLNYKHFFELSLFSLALTISRSSDNTLARSFPRGLCDSTHVSAFSNCVDDQIREFPWFLASSSGKNCVGETAF